MAGSHAPSPRVVAAFGGIPSALTGLAGGQGRSWRAGDIVLKPAGDAEQLAWTGRLLTQVADSGDFRLARPVRASSGDWLVDGWAATRWVDGQHQGGRWEEILQVSAALHQALAAVSAPNMPERDDPWTIGCRVAWGRPNRWAPRGRAGALMADLAGVLQRPWPGPPAQVVHGDLAGNVVFADGRAPGVIDFSAHHAPAPFADAVIVADAMAWEGAPRTLGERFVTRPDGAQLLARAVVYRVVAADGLAGGDQARVQAEIDGYRASIDLALGR